MAVRLKNIQWAVEYVKYVTNGRRTLTRTEEEEARANRDAVCILRRSHRQWRQTTGKAVMNSLADEIVERAKNMLAANSVKAAAGLVQALDDDGTIPRAEQRIKAAESILNRVGVGKHDKVEHNVTALHGVVLLPSKAGQVDPIIINNE